MTKRKRDRTWLYATVFWTSMAIIAVWVVLKAVGIIKTPLWIELLPVASAIFGAGAFFQMAMNTNRNVGAIGRAVAHLRIDFEVLKNDMGYLKSDMAIVKRKLHI